MAALEGLTEAERRILVIYARRWMDIREDAEDAVQDALVNAWRHRDQFRGDEKLLNYLRTCVRNRCLQTIRDRKEWVEFTDRTCSDRADEGANARHTLVRVLSDGNRLAEYLALGMSMAEIGQKLHLSVPCVKTRVHRMRVELKTVFA